MVLETTPGDIVGGVLQGAVEEGLNLPESVKGNLPLDDHLQNVNSTIDTAETESIKGVVKSAAAEALDMIGNSMRTDHENHLDVEDGEHGDALAEAAETADNPGENHVDQEDADFFDDSNDDGSDTESGDSESGDSGDEAGENEGDNF